MQPNIGLSKTTSDKDKDLVKLQVSSDTPDIDVETANSEFTNDLSEDRNDIIDVGSSNMSTESALGSSQNALDLRPGLSTRKDLFANHENRTLKRPHSDSPEQEEYFSSDTSSFLTLAKRFKVTIMINKIDPLKRGLLKLLKC